MKIIHFANFPFRPIQGWSDMRVMIFLIVLVKCEPKTHTLGLVPGGNRALSQGLLCWVTYIQWKNLDSLMCFSLAEG